MSRKMRINQANGEVVVHGRQLLWGIPEKHQQDAESGKNGVYI